MQLLNRLQVLLKILGTVIYANRTPSQLMKKLRWGDTSQQRGAAESHLATRIKAYGRFEPQALGGHIQPVQMLVWKLNRHLLRIMEGCGDATLGSAFSIG